MTTTNIVLNLVNTYSVRHELMNSIENFLQKRTGSPFKNLDAVYFIVSILMNSDFEHYGPETLLQDALNEYNNLRKKYDESLKDFVKTNPFLNGEYLVESEN